MYPFLLIIVPCNLVPIEADRLTKSLIVGLKYPLLEVFHRYPLLK